jgi:hypothetical protein
LEAVKHVQVAIVSESLDPVSDESRWTTWDRSYDVATPENDIGVSSCFVSKNQLTAIVPCASSVEPLRRGFGSSPKA